jgi:hypothetical protein
MNKKLGLSLLTIGFAGAALAGGKGDYNYSKPENFNQNKAYADSFSKSNASVSGVTAIGEGGKAISHSQGGNAEGGIGHGGIGHGGIGQGGSIQPGAVQNRFQGGNTTISGVGNTEFNNPRQTPMAYAPSSFSANPCIMNYSAGGSGAPFGFSLGISAESDECNARADSVRWQEMNMAPVACQRMLVDSDENQAALKAAGLNCNDAKAGAVALPTNQVIPVATPALDAYVPREEFNRKLDNAQRLGAIK